MMAVCRSWEIRTFVDAEATPMTVTDRLAELGLVLPAPARMPPSVVTTFSWVRIVGTRVWSGSAPEPARCGGCGTTDRHPVTLTVGDDHSTKCEHDHVVCA